MLVQELTFQQQPTLLMESHLWKKNVESLKSIDLQVFLRLHLGTNTYLSAMAQTQALIDAAWDATLNQALKPAQFLYFEMPTVNLTADELCAWLSEVSMSRRRAILFALETGVDLPDVVNLTWKSVALMTGLGEIASSLVKASTRHFKLEYVFWEAMPNRLGAAPLFGLEQSALEVSQGMGFNALRRLYKTMIPIDSAADLQSIKQHIPIF